MMTSLTTHAHTIAATTNSSINNKEKWKPTLQKEQRYRKLMANPTAYSLTYEHAPDNPMEAENYNPDPFVTTPLELYENK